MTTIRAATEDDVPRIVEMARAFYAVSGYAEIYGPMLDESAAGLAIIAMEGMPSHGLLPGVMLVAEQNGELVGMVCIHADRFTFNYNVRVGHELVLWVEPDHRGGMLAARLVKAADAAAEAAGIKVNRMAKLPGSPEFVGMLYEGIGYSPAEHYWTKVY